jgi:hypothetical protein
MSLSKYPIAVNIKFMFMTASWVVHLQSLNEANTLPALDIAPANQSFIFDIHSLKGGIEQ